MGLIFTALFILLNLLSPADFFPNLVGTRYNLVIGLLAIFFSLPGLLKAKPWYLVQSTFWFGILVVAMISSAVNGWLGGALIVANAYLTAALVFFLVLANCTTPKRMRNIALIAVAVAIFFVYFGGIAVRTAEAMPNPNLLNDTFKKFVLWQRLDPDKVAESSLTLSFGTRLYLCRLKALGALNDPNDFAQFLLMCIVLLWLMYKPGRRALNFLLIGCPAAFLIYGIFLTHSRGAVVALGLALMISVRKRLGTITSTLLGGITALAVLAIGFTGGRGISSDEGADRLAAWGEGFQMLKTHPIVGVGMDQFKDNYEITAHNSFVLCFAELGLIGYFFWIGMLVATFFGLRWVIQGEKTTGPQTSTLAAAASAEATSNARLGSGIAGAKPQRDELVFAAKVIRMALFAFLVAAWFLSRAYVMSLYMLLGFSAALILAEMKRHPERVFFPTKQLIKYTVTAEFASIVGIYIMLRIANLTK
ncbi:MAG: hypothetical protein NVS9B15_12170 [Acidobacteriaceae bacterium]